MAGKRVAGAASKGPGAPPPRRRAQGARVAVSILLAREDWQRLRALADAEGISLKALALEGLSRVLVHRKLPPID
jgi:hypothetical protein